MTLLKPGEDKRRKWGRPQTQQRAANYLHAFENWLGDRKGFAQALRHATLRDLVGDKVPMTVEEELATAKRCGECGGPILRGRGQGPPPPEGFCAQCARDLAARRGRET